ncbi:sugar phosphate nucleotidyltransferase [Candidatus Pelagibacter sp.]|nr:sugar phosphate nucleotidyltransferase [Candidatus Pelagibacter sp.]
MTNKNLIVDSKTEIKTAMIKLSKSAKKCLIVLDDQKKLIGTLTDGDIRRAFLKGKNFNDKINNIYKKNPISLQKEKFKIKYVKKIMAKNKIDFLPIVNNEKKFLSFITWDQLEKKNNIGNKRIPKTSIVIMAGGKGTRLMPFTNVLPKPLIPLAGKTVLEHIIEKFTNFGIKNFFISINFKSKIIKSYFEEVNPKKYKIFFVKEKKPMGTIGSLRLIENKLQKNILVCNCDTIMNFDYNDLIKFHQKNKFDLTVVASKKNFTIPYGLCEINNQNELKAIKEKPKNKYLVNTGMYLMDRSIIKKFPKTSFVDIDELIHILIKKKKRVGVFSIDDSAWNDLGVWPEYKKTVKKFV